ncbi:MAG: SusC/RagA family TonB-linked outer membrane protein [Sphingobacteriaceae bacterium]|nr:MAG: SusC/RagA family TonB-linked outer membrane protein [Sphingobacteriaceae bacterium]
MNTNLDISGGTDKLKYFISGGGLTQNGLVRDFDDPRAQVNTNYSFKRYNFRSNLDLKASKTLDMRLDITTRFSDLNEPRAQNAVGQVYSFESQTPFSSPYLNPNGSYTYAGLFPQFTTNQAATLNARLATGGYNHARGTDFNALFNVHQKLDMITQGLALTARIAYANTDENSKQVLNFTIPTYRYNAIDDSYNVNLNSGSGYVYDTYILTGGTRNSNANVNLQLFSQWERTFGKSHFNTLLLFNQSSKTFYASTDPFFSSDRIGIPEKFRGTSLKFEYEYDGKYLFTFNGAYNGTDRFAADKRFGLFPAFSVGYRISEEPFFKKLFPTFSLFKIRGSYGIVGSDVTPGNRYIYSQVYNLGDAYSFGESHTNFPAIYEGSLANPNVTWEKAKKFDVGLDLNFLNDKFSVTVDYFHDIRYDQLFQPNNIPLLLGISAPRVNLARTQNTGFDGQVTYRNSFGKFQFNTAFVFSIAKNKVLYQSEAQPLPNLRATGQPIDQPFGYESLGYYTPQDIVALNEYYLDKGNERYKDPVTGFFKPPVAVPVYSNSADNSVHAGDLKYRDLNGDGIIDQFDRKAIGKPNLANTVLGLTLGGSYKNFSINVLFQGSFNYSFAVIGSGIEPLVSQFQPIHLERWTPSTAASAQFPRLTTNKGLVNSPGAYLSDYWLINARYIRLKTIDFGYQFPSSMLPLNLNSARIYFSAYNLFTWTNYNKYQQDPEVSTNSAGDAYINSRVVNLGIQLGF